jgi:hypothetical protein
LGKSEEMWRAYRIILAGYKMIQLYFPDLVRFLGILGKLGEAVFGFFT